MPFTFSHCPQSISTHAYTQSKAEQSRELAGAARRQQQRQAMASRKRKGGGSKGKGGRDDSGRVDYTNLLGPLMVAPEDRGAFYSVEELELCKVSGWMGE